MLRSLSGPQRNSTLLKPVTVDNVHRRRKIGRKEFARLPRICAEKEKAGTSSERTNTLKVTEQVPLPLVAVDLDPYRHGNDLELRWQGLMMRLFGEPWRRSWQ